MSIKNRCFCDTRTHILHAWHTNGNLPSPFSGRHIGFAWGSEFEKEFGGDENSGLWARHEGSLRRKGLREGAEASGCAGTRISDGRSRGSKVRCTACCGRDIQLVKYYRKTSARILIRNRVPIQENL